MVNDGGLLIARGLVHKNEQYKYYSCSDAFNYVVNWNNESF